MSITRTDDFLSQDDFGKIHFEGDHKVHVIKVARSLQEPTSWATPRAISPTKGSFRGRRSRRVPSASCACVSGPS